MTWLRSGSIWEPVWQTCHFEENGSGSFNLYWLIQVFHIVSDSMLLSSNLGVMGVSDTTFLQVYCFNSLCFQWDVWVDDVTLPATKALLIFNLGNITQSHNRGMACHGSYLANGGFLTGVWKVMCWSVCTVPVLWSWLCVYMIYSVLDSGEIKMVAGVCVCVNVNRCQCIMYHV